MSTSAFGILRMMLLLVAIGGCATRSQDDSDEDASPKPRVVVTTDPELDDSNSLVRYLLHSTDFSTEGLIYASSGFHWKGDGTGKTWSRPNREYSRFGLNLCPCESWRWAPNERFIDDAVEILREGVSESARARSELPHARAPQVQDPLGERRIRRRYLERHARV
ncbi:MAG: nucleoside hydrolase-like domain-containing protein [Gemmatimonadaceae bacterium]